MRAAEMHRKDAQDGPGGVVVDTENFPAIRRQAL